MSDGITTVFRDLLPVLSLLLAAGFGARWWIRRSGAVAGGVRVVARTGITRGTVVAVVETDGRRFLVGGGEHGLSVLADLGEAASTSDTSAAVAVAGDSLTIPAAAGQPVSERRTIAGALADLRRPGRATPPSGPRTGLVDRLRAMTVRTTMTQASPDARTPS